MVVMMVIGGLFAVFFLALGIFIFNNRALTTATTEPACTLHDWYEVVWDTRIPPVETIMRRYDSSKVCKSCGKIAGSPYSIIGFAKETLLLEIIGFEKQVKEGVDINSALDKLFISEYIRKHSITDEVEIKAIHEGFILHVRFLNQQRTQKLLKEVEETKKSLQ